MKLADILFKIFNADGTKNREVIRFVPLKVEINRYREQIDIAVTDLNNIDIFLGYNWLVKHNPEVNQNKGTIQFTKCSKSYRTSYQNITFKTRRAQCYDSKPLELG